MDRISRIDALETLEHKYAEGNFTYADLTALVGIRDDILRRLNDCLQKHSELIEGATYEIKAVSLDEKGVSLFSSFRELLSGTIRSQMDALFSMRVAGSEDYLVCLIEREKSLMKYMEMLKHLDLPQDTTISISDIRIEELMPVEIELHVVLGGAIIIREVDLENAGSNTIAFLFERLYLDLLSSDIQVDVQKQIGVIEQIIRRNGIEFSQSAKDEISRIERDFYMQSNANARRTNRDSNNDGRTDFQPGSPT